SHPHQTPHTTLGCVEPVNLIIGPRAGPDPSTVDRLRLEATDGPFATGAGPLVRGSTLALTMAMAGRVAVCADLTGAGASTLVDRTTSST
ncbi:hypothetical protein, partial [Tenggerimyces flavus]